MANYCRAGIKSLRGTVVADLFFQSTGKQNVGNKQAQHYVKKYLGTVLSISDTSFAFDSVLKGLYPEIS
jgi:hypothetical protein